MESWLLPFNSDSLRMSNEPKLLVFVASLPIYAHMEKMAVIAEGLIAHGHDVTFITGSNFKESVERLGATFEPISWKDDLFEPEILAQFMAFTDPREREFFAIDLVFLTRIPVHHVELQNIFTRFQVTYGELKRPILVYDASFLGVGPIVLGADGVRPITIAVSHFPVAIASNDTFPFRSGFPPDTSSQSREIHYAAQTKLDNDPWTMKINAAVEKAMASAGATNAPGRFHDSILTLGDISLHLGIPDFEYPRTDLPPSFEFIGALPTVGLTDEDLPEWWDEVVAAHALGKSIVVVTSSTVEFNINETILPALEGLKDRDDILVVATLVNYETDAIPYEVPANARVARFIPLNLLLPYVSLLHSFVFPIDQANPCFLTHIRHPYSSPTQDTVPFNMLYELVYLWYSVVKGRINHRREV